MNITGIYKPSDSYDRRVAHSDTIKLVNSRYKIPTTLKFTLSPFTSTINITKQYIVIFTAIKIVYPSITVIFSKDTTYHYPKKIPSN